MKKGLFVLSALFLAGILVLLTLVLASDINPFKLSHWIILSFAGFALSLSNFILCTRSKFAKPLLILSIIDFSIILFSLKSPDLFNGTWNFTLAILIAILGLGLYALIPATKNLLTKITKIILGFSFALLVVICIGKIEFAGAYHLEFYTMMISSVLLLLSILTAKTVKQEDF